ncbi:MAG: hypothetical protein Tsb005_18400 [Gammaproteobacteria bacterium]
MDKIIKTDPSVEYAKDVEQICETLFSNTPISYLCAHKYYIKENKYLDFVSNQRWAEHFIKNHYYTSGIEEEVFTNQLDKFLPWSASRLFHVTPESEKLLNDFFDFGYTGGATLTIVDQDTVNIYYFAGKIASAKLDEFFINNEELLRIFAMYFDDTVLNNKQLKNIEPLIFPYNITEPDITKNYEPTLCGNNLKEKMRKFILRDTFKNIYFSKQEIECLIRFFLKKPTKIIAKELSISPKTVERHIENVKIKTQMSTQSLQEALTMSSNFIALVKIHLQSQKIKC